MRQERFAVCVVAMFWEDGGGGGEVGGRRRHRRRHGAMEERRHPVCVDVRRACVLERVPLSGV